MNGAVERRRRRRRRRRQSFKHEGEAGVTDQDSVNPEEVVVVGVAVEAEIEVCDPYTNLLPKVRSCAQLARTPPRVGKCSNRQNIVLP